MHSMTNLDREGCTTPKNKWFLMAPESELLKDESEHFLEENFQPQDLLPKEETQYIIILAVLLVLGKEEETQ